MPDGCRDPSALAWCMEVLIQRAPCHLLQEVKASLTDTVLTYIQQILHEVKVFPLAGRIPSDRQAIFLSFIQSHLQAEFHWVVSTGS